MRCHIIRVAYVIPASPIDFANPLEGEEPLRQVTHPWIEIILRLYNLDVQQPWIPTSAADGLSANSAPSAGSSLRICHPPPERKKVALKVDNFATC